MDAEDILSQINEILIMPGSKDREMLTQIDTLVSEYFIEKREELEEE